MSSPIACNNIKTKNDRFMIYLLMYPPRFRTHACMRSGMPHIRLSRVSPEMLLQADRRFLMRAVWDDAGAILSILSWTIAHRFSIGDRSGLLHGHSPLA